MILTQIPIGEIVTVDEIHENIEKGVFFSGGYYNAAVTASSTLQLLVQVSTNIIHLHLYGTCSQDMTLELYEGPTFSAAGTSVTMSNHNRTSAKTTTTTVTHTPTITGTGTQLNSTQYVPSGAGGGASGGGSGDFAGALSDFYLKSNTDYLIRYTNIGATTAKLGGSLAFYEVGL